MVCCAELHGPKSGFCIARFFRPAQKLSWRWSGLATRVVLISCSVPSSLFSLALTIWAVERPDPCQSCRLLEPLPAHGAQRAPGQRFFISCSFEHGREDCPLGLRTCGPFLDDLFSKRMSEMSFLGTPEGSMELSREGKTIKNWMPEDDQKTMIFKFGVFWSIRGVL